jgi:hypothetical protein
VRKAAIVGFLFVISAYGMAQSNDVALTAGGYFAVSNPLDLGAAFALEGTVAHEIASVPFASAAVEIPIAGSFKSSIPSLAGTTLARSYTSLFITPGLRLRLAPSFPISPYLSAGLGYARFNRTLFNGGTSAQSSFAVDIGGGLDFKVLPFVSFRGEIRDFNSGGLDIASLAFGRQNNLFATVGLAVRF